MEKSCTFIRGQVWHWEDPMYGKKEEGGMVATGEATVRFSRYVIIVQTTFSIGKSSVSVIPCSSTNSTPHDVIVPLAHLFYENLTYAKVQFLFPVHPKSLQRYVCTLSDSVMRRIESELIKLFTPTISEKISHEELKKYGLDLTVVEDHPPLDTLPNISTENDYKKETPVSKERVWTDERRLRFLNVYKEHGSDAAAMEFGINEASAVSYWYKWKSRLDPLFMETPKTNDDMPINSIPVPYTGGVYLAISKVANMMRDILHTEEAYDKVTGYWRDSRNTVMPEEFYSKSGNCIYHSLLEFLNIKRDADSRELIIPEVDDSTSYLGTWYFLDKIYNEKRISYIKQGRKMMDAYRKHHGDIHAGIDRDWLKVLQSKLSHKLNLIDAGLCIICDIIGDTFCTPREINLDKGA